MQPASVTETSCKVRSTLRTWLTPWRRSYRSAQLGCTAPHAAGVLHGLLGFTRSYRFFSVLKRHLRVSDSVKMLNLMQLKVCRCGWTERFPCVPHGAGVGGMTFEHHAEKERGRQSSSSRWTHQEKPW
jgi:hypothetical protein